MDEAFLRQRRNLIAMSIGLSLYMLAGGKVQTLFGVTLDNPEVALIFAWFGFFYFWWRSKLYQGSPMDGRFKSEQSHYLSIDEYAKTLAHKYLKRKYLKLNLPAIKYEGDIIIAWTGKLKDLVFSYTNLSQQEEAQIGSKFIPVNKADQVIILFRLWVLTAMNGKAFTDYFIPYLLAELTVITGIWKAAEWFFKNY